MMQPEQSSQSVKEIEAATAGQFSGEAEQEETAAWEQVATGRYMPLRIKGSFRGRALG
jgi:hypothetical protein